MSNDTSVQYLRACSLIVYGLDDNGLDLSELRIKFGVKRTNFQTPNSADIRVYNLSTNTAQQIKTLYTPFIGTDGLSATKGKVILQAGYAGNIGVIFQGNIKQIIIGRESATDTFIDIIAGDGDLAYNYAVVNKTLAAGISQDQQLNAAVDSMNSRGVTKGYVELGSTTTLPRGKVMFGNAINYLRNIAQTTDQDWSIQDEQVQFVGVTTYAPGERVILTSKTGLIGTPEQTNEGVNMKCLLNPLLKVGSRVQIDNSAVQNLKVDLNAISPSQIAASIPAPLTADGVYQIIAIEYEGDTRGQPWYCNLVTLNIDVSSNPSNSISTRGFF